MVRPSPVILALFFGGIFGACSESTDLGPGDPPDAGPDAISPPPPPPPRSDAGNDARADGDAPEDAAAGSSPIDIIAGGGRTFVRFDDGTVKGWGENSEGGLGIGDTRNRGDLPGDVGGNLPRVDLGPGRTALQLAAGLSHTCARLDDATVKCWGGNSNGQLGLGDTKSRGDGPGEMGANLPIVDLGPGRIAIQLTAGTRHTCARLDDSTVKCWGDNGDGELGLGDRQSRGDGPGEMGANLPTVDLGPGRIALELSAGASHTCARLDDGTVKCWGDNRDGQLGLGVRGSRGVLPGEMGANLPVVDLGPGRTALQLAAGYEHTCARLNDRTVKCWGAGGRLGLGDRDTRGVGPREMGASLPIVDLGPGRTALELSAGASHTCARLDTNTVKCWGASRLGELGLGDTQTRGDGPGEMGANLLVVDLGPGATTLQLSVGAAHTCARLTTGTVKCWGYNESGTLGLGDTQNRGDGPGEMGAGLPPVPIR